MRSMNSTAAILLGESGRGYASRPWFSVRSSLLFALGALSLVLATVMLRPDVIDYVLVAVY